MASNADRILAVCSNCGTETPMSDLDAGDVCPECKTAIPDDAAAKVPTDIADGHLDKVIDDEPMGGYQFEADEITKPERDVEGISATLAAVEQGDVVEVTLGAVEFQETVNLYVVTHEEDVAGFEHRVSMCPRPREDGWTRLYTTGIGTDPELDSWEVVSAPYDLDGDGTLDMRDYAAHGWVIGAEPTDESPDRIDGGDHAE